MAGVTFPELADDVWIKILGFVSSLDVLHLEQTCRGLRQLGRENDNAIFWHVHPGAHAPRIPLQELVAPRKMLPPFSYSHVLA
jgi:F-box domain